MGLGSGDCGSLRSDKGRSDLDKADVALIASALPAAHSSLCIAHHRQYRPQPLVVGNGG
jgi:hypothetical protein